ncbi:MAG: DnaA/Hda family protein [Chloroflexota bacterium]|nr:DnaA/Hda family protein [Chloroflexota bacterium]
MESLKEILNKRKFSTNYYDEFSNQSDYVECEICDSARWIIVNKQTVPCSSCQQNNTDEAEINIKLMHAGLSQLLEYDLKKFQIDGRIGKANPKNLRKNLRIAEDYSKNPMGWLLISGEPGTGKTHLAVGIAINCIKNENTVLYKSIQEIIDIITNSTSNSEEENFNEIIDYPFIIIDDYGNQKYSEWIEEKIDHLFTYRYTRKLPTVVIINKNLSDFDDRTKSRFSDPNLVQSIHLDSKDSTHQSNGIPKVFDNAKLRKQPRKQNKELTREEKITFDSIEMALLKSKEFVESPNPTWLYIHGGTGSGKSYLTAAIANEIYKKNKNIFYISSSELIDNVRDYVRSNQGKGYVYDLCKEVDYLFLDDLWGHNNTKWSDEIIYNLIAYRQDNLKYTVINSSIFYEKIKSYNSKTEPLSSDSIFTEKIASRLSNNNLVEQISLVSTDIRKKRLARKR